MKRCFCNLVLVLLFAMPHLARADDDNELVIASPHWEGIRQEFGTLFQEYSAKHGGTAVTIRWLDLGGTAEIMRYLKSEFERRPDGVAIDVLFGGGLEPYLELKKRGLLEKYQPPPEIFHTLTPELLGSPLYDPDAYWYAATMAGFGLVWNKKVLSYLSVPAPNSWKELTDPRLFSWVSSADPGKSGAAHMFYEIILQAYGWELGWKTIYGIAGNIRGFANAAGQVPKDVLQGEAAVGFALDSYAAEAMRQSGPEYIGFAIPENASSVAGDGIAILKGAPHRKAAEVFMELVLSKEGQSLFLLNPGEPGGPRKNVLAKASVLSSLYEELGDRVAVSYNPFKASSGFTYNSDLSSARRQIVSDLLSTFVVNRHSELIAKSKSLAAEGSSLFAYMKPPISESQLQEFLRTKELEQQSVRNSKLVEWTAAAKNEFAVEGAGYAFWARVLPSMVLLLMLAVRLIRRLRRRLSAIQ